MSTSVYTIITPDLPEDVLRAHAEALASDIAQRPTLRKTAFDTGAEPLPGWSWPPPRRTVWERD